MNDIIVYDKDYFIILSNLYKYLFFNLIWFEKTNENFYPSGIESNGTVTWDRGYYNYRI